MQKRLIEYDLPLAGISKQTERQANYLGPNVVC
jgi:hypothetical protein